LCCPSRELTDPSVAAYLIKKILYGILVAWGVISIVFLLFHVLPGDPARMMAGQRADESTLERIRKDLGLDRPLHVRYLGYLNDLSPLSLHDPENRNSFIYLEDGKYENARVLFCISRHRCLVLKPPYLGRSFQSRERVGTVLMQALPNTFILAFCSMFLAFIMGTGAGILAAIRKDGIYDRSILVVSSLGMSLPSFFAAILIGWLFAYKLQDLTGLNLTGNIVEVDEFGRGTHLCLKNLILPALTLAIRPLSVVVQLSRNSMLEVLSQDYIRTAKAKGLSFARVIRKHALKNSLNPVITAVSGWFASLMAGVIFVEYIFGWKGLGYIIVNALNNYDFPLVLGSVILISVIFVGINILVDFVYAMLDPRIQFA
jgi:peptide/nickel transport system permease protein